MATPKVVMEKKFSITAELGTPTTAYFDMVTWLGRYNYTVKKVDDWLYINPKTAHHAEVAQRRQAIEQRLAQVMIAIGDLRKDVELLKHDLRKFEGALEHHKKNDLDVLKSDYLDFVDQQTPNSIFKLAAQGRFPSIVVDFFKVKNEKDIDGLKISKSEKSLLKVKWRLFEQWRAQFAKGVEDRVRVLREEINSRQAALENYKMSIRPYLEAIHKIRISEHTPPDVLSNPALIEGYITSVAGVDLVAWRGVTVPGKPLHQAAREYTVGEKEFLFYVYFEITIKRNQVVVKGKEIEEMAINVKSYLKSGEEINEKEKEIKEKGEEMMRALEEFRGEREVAGKKEKAPEEEESILGKMAGKLIVSPGRKLTGMHKEGKYWIAGSTRSSLERVVKEQTIEFYDALKEITGGMKFQRYPTVEK